MNEKTIYKLLKKSLPNLHICRIENNIISGLPDIICVGKHNVFVELKANTLSLSTNQLKLFRSALASNNKKYVFLHYFKEKYYIYTVPTRTNNIALTVSLRKLKLKAVVMVAVMEFIDIDAVASYIHNLTR